MRSSRIQHARTVLQFIFLNFAPPIAFFCVFQLKGAKPAIAVAVVLTVIQVLTHLVLRQRLSPFFLTASAFTALFGCMDFMVHEPRFFRLEPFAENFMLGILFGLTVLANKPIALWFAQAMPVQLRPDLSDGTGLYLRQVTIAWIIYFFTKSAVFLYLAFQVDLGKLIVLRTIIGGVSLAVMFGGEILYRKKIRGRVKRI